MSGDERLIKLRARVRQLLALARGGRCTEAEAVNAASIADRLMREHGFTEADIEASQMAALEVPSPGGGMPVTWWQLAATLAEHCDLGIFASGEETAYFGHEPDLVIVEYLHAVCLRAVRLGLAEFRRSRSFKRRKPASKAAASQAFVLGMAASIGWKLQALKGDDRPTETKRARVKEEMNRRYKLTSREMKICEGRGLDRARRSGFDAGEEVDLRRGLSGGEPVRAIGGGR